MLPNRSDNKNMIVRRNAVPRTDDTGGIPLMISTANNDARDHNIDTSESKSSSYKTDHKSKIKRYRILLWIGVIIMLGMAFVRNMKRKVRMDTSYNLKTNQRKQKLKKQSVDVRTPQDLPPGFKNIFERAMAFSQSCRNLQPESSFSGFDTRSILPFHNDTVASLPSFGIIDALQNDDLEKSWPVCPMPPSTECEERQFTVVFMAYNPDRLGITLKQIKTLLSPADFHNLVHEIILVWNGERHVDESKEGRALLEFMQEKQNPVRIVYPLKMGLPNDLFNRYHPDVVQVKTKAILYYDDDGPFYSFAAIQAGFELWKRHADAQIGAMARQITYSSRQVQEHQTLLGTDPTIKGKTTAKPKPADDQFVSHCTNVNDQVDYQFRFFANYDANMVLPSGSFLHSNYLCFLWHPVFAEIRKFILLHPVHPDDMTVSMIVSQLSGKAPRVYSRRLNPPDKKDQRSSVKQKQEQKRRLLANVSHANDWKRTESDVEFIGVIPQSELQRHRRLLFSICWDCGSGMTEMKQFWAELRTEAVNALVRYFGSINSGSIGWCPQDSEYYQPQKDGRCDPIMARQGWLPWMNEDGTPKETCP